MANIPEKSSFSKEEEKIAKPSLYNIFYLNDDYTSFDFVIASLIHFFHKSKDEAIVMANNGHEKGKFCAGTDTFEIAETKAYCIMENAKKHGFPLKVVLEKVN